MSTQCATSYAGLSWQPARTARSFSALARSTRPSRTFATGSSTTRTTSEAPAMRNGPVGGAKVSP
ncbi:hypothetical protein [Ornithinimicrobium kibberense]|uniref:hypothetical protein n=1 Tax=Ornithinimicrobium kibberense TaxID=282060 RepID=UPI00361EF989